MTFPWPVDDWRLAWRCFAYNVAIGAAMSTNSRIELTMLRGVVGMVRVKRVADTIAGLFAQGDDD